MRPMRRAAIILAVLYYTVACSRNTYECMERTEKKTPNFPQPGDYRFVDYVLLHNGQKIQATCDLKAVGRLDSAASCGLLPHQIYHCTTLPSGKFPADLRCTDSEGKNVYLFVWKKD